MGSGTVGTANETFISDAHGDMIHFAVQASILQISYCMASQ